MTKRTYNQFCPLAISMDIIGERWTLLIVRELLPSPRRYTDLQNALPSMGTNLLAKRLKALDELNIIQQRVLPPPASSTVYELTPYGAELEDMVLALTRWGFKSMQMPPPPDAHFTVSSAMVAMKAFFSPDLAQNIDITIELHLENEVYQVRIADRKIHIQVGSVYPVDVIMQLPIRMLMGMIGGLIPPESVAPIKGDLQYFLMLMNTLHTPTRFQDAEV